MQTLLQYKQGKVGGCSVIVHPQWQVWRHPLYAKFSEAESLGIYMYQC